MSLALTPCEVVAAACDRHQPWLSDETGGDSAAACACDTPVRDYRHIFWGYRLLNAPDSLMQTLVKRG